MAARDRALADAIAAGVRAADPSLVLFGLPGSELIRAGESAGLAVAAEGFADRAYHPDGSLAPRATAGAVLHDPAVVVQRAVAMIANGRVTATDGSELTFRVDTLCVHGDTPGAAELVRRLREGLERNGVTVRPHRSPDRTRMTVSATRVGGAGPFGWWRDGTPEAQRALIAAGLGWMLDAFDVMLYALLLSSIIADLGSDAGRPPARSGPPCCSPRRPAASSFGVVADRYGRTRALMASVLIYSIFTARAASRRRRRSSPSFASCSASAWAANGRAAPRWCRRHGRTGTAARRWA